MTEAEQTGVEHTGSEHGQTEHTGSEHGQIEHTGSEHSEAEQTAAEHTGADENNQGDEKDDSPLAAYPIRLDSFEGPLGLLLRLIEQQEMDVTEVALAAVTDQYLQYIEDMEALDLEVASEFVVVASRLLDIKARTLLPPDRPEADEEGDDVLDDPARDLLERLEQYRRFKEVARLLAEREDDESMRFPRTPAEIAAIEETADLEGVTLADLAALVDELLQEASRRGQEPEMREIQAEGVTVGEQIRRVLWVMRREGGRAAFTDIFPQQATRLEVVVTFLAVLELLRRRRIRARQEKPLAPIYLEQISGEEESAGG